MEQIKLDRQTPPTPEIAAFADSAGALLAPFKLKKCDQHWKTHHRSWSDPKDEVSYHVLFENQFVRVDLRVFTGTSTDFITLGFQSLQQQYAEDAFILAHYCAVIGSDSYPYPPPHGKGVENFKSFLSYLTRLLAQPAMSALLEGKYWFNFHFDVRDQASDPALIPSMREHFRATLRAAGLSIES